MGNYRENYSNSTHSYTTNNYTEQTYHGNSCSGYGCGCSGCRCNGYGCNHYGYQKQYLRGLQLQLGLKDVLEIQSREPIIFDKKVSQISSNVGYDSKTGSLYIVHPGIYFIEWWVATQSVAGGQDTFVSFSLISSEGHCITAANQNTFGQVTGNALLCFCASLCQPVWLSLINATDGIIGLGQVPIKANLVIFEVAQ